MAEKRRPLTQNEKALAFRKVTASFPKRYADQIAAGMSDDDLSKALQATLGILGGSAGPNQLSTLIKALVSESGQAGMFTIM